ncbi:acyl-CoA carboxylase epsilon subunit [Kribbella endophytica]
MTDTPAEAPVLRVVKGDPTPEELAALVAVVAARAAAVPAPADPERASDWATYWRHAKRPLHAGPNRWRASAHP